MKLATTIPCERLRPFIKAIVLQETDDEQTYKVLPGTGLVMSFQYMGNLARVDDAIATPLSTSGITGLLDGYRIFKNAKKTGTVLVLFKETGAAPFLRQPLHEVFNESVSLDNFVLRSELLVLEDKLCSAGSDVEKINVVEQFLIARLDDEPADKLVTSALALIHSSKGDIKISDLCKQLYTSQSPLEKRFRKAVGATPKKYASIIRFKYLLQYYPAATSLTQLGYEAGFYDQAHFIKEFKTFTGLTPESYFSENQ